MRHLPLLLIPLILFGVGCRAATRAPIELTNVATDSSQQLAAARQVPLSAFVTVSAGDQLAINGLFIEILKISSLTAQGCEGGPIGCPDSVDFRVTFSNSSQTFTLAVLNGDKQIASSERIVFGYRFLLSSVTKTNATIAVYLAEPPTIQPTPSQ